MRISKAVFVLAGVLLLASPSWAEKQKGAGKSKTRPIEMQLQIFGQMKYSLDGVELHGYKELEDLIDPLEDPMASYSLKNAKNEEAFSWPVMLLGGTAEIVALVDGLSRYNNWKNTGAVQDYTFDWAVFLGGATFVAIGAIVQGQAQVDKFNAVKRYNQVVRGEDKVSLFYSPEKKQLSLTWAAHF
jgi:hypothetical protein